jgi:hypothetical protein
MEGHRKIEITEPTGIKATTRQGDKDVPIIYNFGEDCWVPTAEADIYVNAGWAKDSVTGEQGVRVPGSVRLDAVVNRSPAGAA